MKKSFEEDSVPPPDFDAIQVLEGNRIPSIDANIYPYYDLLRRRAGNHSGSPLVATGGSNSKLPFNEEVGYPRIYLYTIHDTIDKLTSADIVHAVRNQHLFFTNGPLPIFSALDLATGRFSKMPGDVLNLSTTNSLNLKVNVLAAPWIDLQGFNINYNDRNGTQLQKIEIMPSRSVLRYPAHKLPDADKKVMIVDSDGVVDLMAFSSRRSLSPVVPRLIPDLGGAVFPIALTGPIYVDKNGDGKIEIPPKK
jgi:hypothetical protein